MTGPCTLSPVDDPAFHLVLLNPEIPNNTGNMGRTAAATGCRLHIIHPIAFDMSEKAARRAGLDYWHLVDCREHESWEAFLRDENPSRLWLYTTRTDRPHWEAQFRHQSTRAVPSRGSRNLRAYSACAASAARKEARKASLASHRCIQSTSAFKRPSTVSYTPWCPASVTRVQRWASGRGTAFFRVRWRRIGGHR